MYLSFSKRRRPPTSTLFPYTTLFRSQYWQSWLHIIRDRYIALGQYRHERWYKRAQTVAPARWPQYRRRCLKYPSVRFLQMQASRQYDFWQVHQSFLWHDVRRWHRGCASLAASGQYQNTLQYKQRTVRSAGTDGQRNGH